MKMYPLKFTPILKSKIWGGNKLNTILQKETCDIDNIGESWEISSVPGELSIISNGDMAGTNIKEAITSMKEKLVGRNVYDQFGDEFPLLIKFIDANDYLSVQVHPDDELAKQRHDSFGKTEMWYIINAEEGAELIVGFKENIDKAEYLLKVENSDIKSILNFEKVKTGDVFHLSAGRIHATGSGILFAEIQQTSDITYRVYDWDRTDKNGNKRELHQDLAIEAIDFNKVNEYKTQYSKEKNTANNITSCKYFTTNYLPLTGAKELNYSGIDSFIILMAVGGDNLVYWDNYSEYIELKCGETTLIPAAINNIKIQPLTSKSEILEVYIK